MKIGILTNTFPPNINGVSVSIDSLKTGLEKEGHQVFIATPEVDGYSYPPEILPLNAATLNDKFSGASEMPYLYTNQVADFFKANNVEIIHTHDTLVGGAEGAMVALTLGIPSIHTFHTFIEDYNYIQFPGYKTYIRNHTQIVCNFYNHIIAPSQKVYKYLLEIGVKVPISHIPNVINFPLPKEDLNRLEILEQLNQKTSPTYKKYSLKKSQLNLSEIQQIQPQDFVFITFSRIAKEKGIQTAIQVLAPILRQFTDTKLLICGSGPELATLKELAEQESISKKVIFTDRYERHELALLSPLADVFVFTSRTENLPTNLLEAMYYELPVLAIDDDSVDYLLKNNINGFKTIENDISIKSAEMYFQREKTKKMGLEARKTAIQFLSQDQVTKHLQLYTHAIEAYQEKKPAEETQSRISSIHSAIQSLLKPFK